MAALEIEWTEPAPFHVWIDDAADPPCVGVSGEVDLQTCAAFREALNDTAAVGSRAIAVDLRGVVFMGSTGIRELVRVARTVDRVELRAPRPIVRRALEASHLGERVAIVD